MREKVCCVVVLVSCAAIGSAAEVPASDPELAKGIKLVEQGEYGEAIIALDPVAKRLERDPKQKKLAAQAHLYLGIAYVGQGQERLARASFREALVRDPQLSLSAFDVSPTVRNSFQAASDELAQEKRIAAPPPKKKGGSKAPLILLGVGAAAAGVALAGGGGGGAAPTTTPVTAPPQPTLSDLSASVSSPQHNANIPCTQGVFVTVTLTNRARSAVSVTGVRRQGSTVAGGCSPAATFTYTPSINSVGPGATEVVLSRGLYSSGSGCCNGRCRGEVCTFHETLDVVTSLGNVTAGTVAFTVTFRNCQQCSSSSTAEAALDCPSEAAP